MIIGLLLRYYKTYQGINYIPLTDEDQFCGLVGNNGVGKSSILESLDTFFNGKPWNFNTATKKSGMSSTKPEIIPIFLLEKNLFSDEVIEKAELLSKVALSISDDNVALAQRPHVKRFIDHRDKIISNVDMEKYFLLPIGINHNNSISISLFNGRKIVELTQGEGVDEGKSSLGDDEMEMFNCLLEEIKGKIEYIYIPREIDPESFTKLETKEIQILMGETLNQILSERVPQRQINDINASLNAFISTLSEELEVYSYRTPTDRQQNLKKNDLYNLITEAFFSIRKLHKKQGDNWLEIASLSSGEKQKAVIDVAHSLLSKHRESGANLIIGVDEPESSLHMSACFDQFDALYDISRDCKQVIFSSHWYGFLPTIESGSATVISKRDGAHVFDQINLASYREQIKQLVASSRGRLPYDIRLKSINDFVQSVITSSIGERPFSWIICEGSSERLYLNGYFSDLLEAKRVRIVPVGGAKEIRRLYNHLSTSYVDFKDEISGKIILISDTDSQLVKYDVSNHDNLICKRIVNCDEAGKTRLVNIQANPVSPKTEIEDALNGRLFLSTLRSFVDEYPEYLDFLKDIEEPVSENAAKISLDLRGSEWKKIDEFFNVDDIKFRFSREYVSLMSDKYKIPEWIQEIRGWLE